MQYKKHSIVTLEGYKDVYPITTPWTEYDEPDLNQPGSTCGIKADGRNYDHPLNIYGYVKLYYLLILYLLTKTHTSYDQLIFTLHNTYL